VDAPWAIDLTGHVDRVGRPLQTAKVCPRPCRRPARSVLYLLTLTAQIPLRPNAIVSPLALKEFLGEATMMKKSGSLSPLAKTIFFWLFISEISCVVLTSGLQQAHFRNRSPAGETKGLIHRRITKQLFPALCVDHKTTIADRVKQNINWCAL
jgi:hypothetical protein